MATKIIKEIDLYDSRYHFKIGILFCFCLILISFLLKNINKNDSIPFVANFNYVEGINNDTEVKIAGIKIGDVSEIAIASDQVTVNGYIDKNYDIPEDSIIKIKSDGIFGKKVLSIEPTPVQVKALLRPFPKRIVINNVRTNISTPRPTLFINSDST